MVLTKSNSGWQQSQIIDAPQSYESDNSANMFGINIDLDNETLVIGDGIPNNKTGLVHIYEMNLGIWEFDQTISASDGEPNTSFGMNENAISIFGNTIAVGSRFNSPPYQRTGAVYIYERDQGSWSEVQKLEASPKVDWGEFGYSVELVNENELFVSAFEGSGPQTEGGRIYYFKKINGSWAQQDTIFPSLKEAYTGFGRSVKSKDNTLFVGAYTSNDMAGKVFIFEKDGNDVWVENSILDIGAVGTKWYGFDMSISNDMLIVGAPHSQSPGERDGAVFIHDIVFFGQNTPSSITGTFSSDVNIGGFGFGTLIATDIDGLTDGSYFTISTPPVNGQALINAVTGNWIYTANNSYTGSDPFTVMVTDDLGGTTEQVVSITITAPDLDGDGAYDHQDNCPSVSNADQANLDGDAFGDSCDNDKDGDGFTSDFDLNDLNAFYSTDPDGDGVDSSGKSHYENNICLKPPGCNDNDPCITVCYVPPQDNCPIIYNSDQNDLDNDNIGDVCDLDADGDGLLISFEDRLGGSDMDANDASFVLSNANTYFENAPADADLDGVPDEYETAAGGDTTSSTFESVLAMLSVNKNVPAMGGLGLLILGISPR